MARIAGIDLPRDKRIEIGFSRNRFIQRSTSQEKSSGKRTKNKDKRKDKKRSGTSW